MGSDGPVDTGIDAGAEVVIEMATSSDVETLLPLMEAYCDFYRWPSPGRQALAEMARAEIEAGDDEGMFIVARTSGQIAGFAHVTWKTSLLHASRVAVMEDLFVDPGFRRRGIARQLVDAATERSRTMGAAALQWITEPSNTTAQILYDQTGAQGEAWIEYELDLR